jgi:hypothetical protein
MGAVWCAIIAALVAGFIFDWLTSTRRPPPPL